LAEIDGWTVSDPVCFIGINRELMPLARAKMLELDRAGQMLKMIVTDPDR
jgi:hypothetical protein